MISPDRPLWRVARICLWIAFSKAESKEDDGNGRMLLELTSSGLWKREKAAISAPVDGSQARCLDSEDGPCIDCGSWEDLEIDLKDRSTKKRYVGRIWSYAATKRTGVDFVFFTSNENSGYPPFGLPGELG